MTRAPRDRPTARPAAASPPRGAIVASAPLMSPGRITGLRIGSAGHIPAKHEQLHRPFSLYAVGLVLAGRGTYRAGEGEDLAITAGCAFAVFPGPSFHYGPLPGTTWEERFLTVSGPQTQRWLDAGWLWTDGTVRILDRSAELVEHHVALVSTMRRGGYGDSDRAVVLAERFLMELYYARAAFQRARQPPPAIAKIISHCREHFQQAIDFQQLAHAHAMSYSSLRQQIRRTTGFSPARYLAQLRCDEARRLLVTTDLPVKNIAHAVGIDDPYTFSRTFKNRVGIAPEHYRQQQAPWTGSEAGA